MGSLIISWFVSIFILSFTFNNFSQSRSLKKLNSAVVVGTLYCDTCTQEDYYSKANHFISGALVAVECGNNRSKPTFRQEARTNENGEFEVHLPFSVTKHVKKIKGCSVKLLKSSHPSCSVAASATSTTLRLKSRKQGTYIFSAGLFTIKPLDKPKICNKKLGNEFTPEEESAIPSPPGVDFPPPIHDPEVPFIPPIPDLPRIPPLPNLPPLPPIPKIPTLPLKTEQSPKANIVEESYLGGTGVPQIPLIPSPPTAFGIPLPPNPFQPPPSIFPPIPNPFQPPPSIFPPIPNPLQPPPSIFPPINFPPLIPGLIPPSPPPPTFPIPFPPFPFTPAPGFPGSPPSPKKASP